MLHATIVDYGVGNIHSLRKALERAGAAVTTATDPGAVDDAEHLVLPGVGAFGHVMEGLAPVRDALLAAVARGVPTLGVCVGMQILFESSDEDPVSGLGLLRGRVRRLRHAVLPHMGWNDVDAGRDPLFAGVAPGEPFYFVHSFAPDATAEAVVARAAYGEPFGCAVRKDRLLGVQFHPEKSSAAGARVLSNFLAVR